MIEPVSGALNEAGREALVILYTPVVDRTFSALTRRADRYIEVVADEPNLNPIRTTRAHAAKRPASLRAADAGGVVMGRTFPSVRQGVNSTADRWARSARALKKEDQR